MVGTRSARELAALGPGTMLCDGNAYIFTFLAAASEHGAGALHSLSMLLSKADTQARLHSLQIPGTQPTLTHSWPKALVAIASELNTHVHMCACTVTVWLGSNSWPR